MKLEQVTEEQYDNWGYSINKIDKKIVEKITAFSSLLMVETEEGYVVRMRDSKADEYYFFSFTKEEKEKVIEMYRRKHEQEGCFGNSTINFKKWIEKLEKAVLVSKLQEI